MAETLDLKRLRAEAVTLARKQFEAATTTKEKHHARLALQRAIRAQTAFLATNEAA